MFILRSLHEQLYANTRLGSSPKRPVPAGILTPTRRLGRRVNNVPQHRTSPRRAPRARAPNTRRPALTRRPQTQPLWMIPDCASRVTRRLAAPGDRARARLSTRTARTKPFARLGLVV